MKFSSQRFASSSFLHSRFPSEKESERLTTVSLPLFTNSREPLAFSLSSFSSPEVRKNGVWTPEN